MTDDAEKVVRIAQELYHWFATKHLKQDVIAKTMWFLLSVLYKHDGNTFEDYLEDAEQGWNNTQVLTTSKDVAGSTVRK